MTTEAIDRTKLLLVALAASEELRVREAEYSASATAVAYVRDNASIVELTKSAIAVGEAQGIATMMLLIAGDDDTAEKVARTPTLNAIMKRYLNGC